MKIKNFVLGAVVNNGKILLIRRSEDPFRGQWGMPSGKLEFGEHVRDGVVREIGEETGLKTDFVDIKGIATEMIHCPEKPCLHGTLFVCLLSTACTDFTGGDEGELGWFDLTALPKEKMIQGDYAMIKEFIIKKGPLRFREIRITDSNDGYTMDYFR